jgi:hypothetical protein
VASSSSPAGTAVRGVDHAGEHALALARVGVGVGVDDLLVDQPGHLDREVGIIGEHRRKAGPLAGGE